MRRVGCPGPEKTHRSRGINSGGADLHRVSQSISCENGEDRVGSWVAARKAADHYLSRIPRGKWGGRWDLNPRHSEPQSDALPTELRPPERRVVYYLPAFRSLPSGKQRKNSFCLAAARDFSLAFPACHHHLQSVATGIELFGWASWPQFGLLNPFTWPRYRINGSRLTHCKQSARFPFTRYVGVRDYAVTHKTHNSLRSRHMQGSVT
jgi:hypothetical protein